MSRRLLLIVAIIAGVTVALWVWFLLGPGPEPDVAQAPPERSGEARAHGVHAGAAHQAPHPHETPTATEPSWSLELDERAGRVLEEAGLGWRLTCEAQDGLEPGPADTLFEDTFVLPPFALPEGRMRVEVTERRGVRGMHDHGLTRGLMIWDVDASPPCLMRPTPSRYVVDRIPDHVEGMVAWVCDTELDIGPDGTIDEEVDGSHKVHNRNGQLVCPFGVRLDGEVILQGFVPMVGSGPARIMELREVESDPDEVVLELEDRLAELEERASVMDGLYTRRIEGLKRLVDADPVLADSVRERLARVEAEYEKNREGYRSYLEDQLQEQE